MEELQKDKRGWPVRLRHLAWLPIGLLLAAMAVLWVADLRTSYESPRLLIVLNFIFSLLTSTFVAYLFGRSFLVRREPGLLMLACGVIIWGAAALVGIIAGLVNEPNGQFDINTVITIHNISVVVSALCQLAGAALSLKPREPLCAARLWLAGAYTGALVVVGLVTLSALHSLTPTFFVQGQGGTLVRYIVLSSATVMFVLTSAMLMAGSRRVVSPFLYWYAMAMALIATGLFGIMIESVHASLLSWTGRTAQLLSGVYMLIAAIASVRESHGQKISLAAVEEIWRESDFIVSLRQQTPLGLISRYGLAVVAVAAALGLRVALTAWVGPGLATYVTFYPAVMVVALVAGFGPGIAATVLAGFAVGYLILPPIGQFAIASPVDRLGLVIFTGMGLFMSVVAELYHRSQDKAAAYDREAAVREGEERLRLALRATALGTWDYNPVTGVLKWDARCKELFGLGPAAEVNYDTFLAGLYPEDRDRVHQVVQGTFDAASGGLFDITYRTVGLMQDVGALRWIRATGRATFNEAGQAIRFIGTVEDITGRKRAEEELAKMSRILSEGQKIAHLGSWEYIADTSETIWSEEEFRLYGLEPGPRSPSYEELLAKHIHPDDVASLQETFGQALRNGSVFEMDLRIVRPDGSVRLLYNLAYPHFDETGKLVKFMGAALDITERKKTEQELERAKEELEHRVKERTKQLQSAVESLQGEVSERLLAEQALRTSQRELRSLASELSVAELRERRRIAVLLHEHIGQLLAAIKIKLGGVQATVLSDGPAKSIEEIRWLTEDAIKSTRSLTSEISPPSLYTLGLGAALDEMCEKFRAGHDIACAFEDDGKAPAITEDLRGVLFRAVDELLMNVVKHAHATSVKVSLCSPNNLVELKIQDNGIGFNLSELEAHPATDVGFGLLSIRERLNHLGGSVSIASAPGGTSVTLVLPIIEAKTARGK